MPLYVGYELVYAYYKKILYRKSLELVMEVQNTNLVRKQYLMSKQELSKINAISVSEKKPAAEVVRDAVRAYNPSSFDSEEATIDEFIAFLSSELKITVDATNAASAKVNAIVKELER